jgi:hypothetical protein
MDKKLVFYNDGAKKKKKKTPVVVVGTGDGEDIWYSRKLQQEISSNILNYGLKCSIMRFEFCADWNAISRRGTMSKEFIDVFADRIEWDYFAVSDKMTEKLMDKHADKVNWDIISRVKDLSKKFIIRHFNELNIDVLIQRKLITVDELDKIEEDLKQKKWDEARDAEDIANRFDMMDMEE